MDPIAHHKNLALLEVVEPHLLTMLRADRRLAYLIQGQLSPTVALIYPGAVDTVVQHLRRLGHFPRVVTPAKERP